MPENNPLIDLAIAEAEAVSGRDLAAATRRFGPGARLAQVRTTKPPLWAPWEEQYVQANLGLLSYPAMAHHLGRSSNAIRIRVTRMGWRPPSKRPGWLTANKVGHLMRKDPKTILRWTLDGRLPFRFTPNIRKDVMISMQSLRRFLVHPNHFMMYQVDRIQDPKLRRLCQLAHDRWGDQWWTPGQVAGWHSTTYMAVSNKIRAGLMPAVRWGNWWIRRSIATNPGFVFFTGKGKATMLDWSDEGDAYLVASRARGDAWSTIAARMNQPLKRLAYRYRWLEKKGRIPLLIAKFGLEEG